MPSATITQSYPAHNLDSNQRQTLALELIKKKKPVSDISKQNNVSRKFLYQQKVKAHYVFQGLISRATPPTILASLSLAFSHYARI